MPSAKSFAPLFKPDCAPDNAPEAENAVASYSVADRVGLSLPAMAGRIPESFINDLLARVDIVDVIGPRVQLKKSGRNHKGLCPFHDEKTPSFNVNEDRQSFHCFGCEAHGTAIGFLMEYDNQTFPEAIETLASMVGMEVPREAGRGPKVDTELYDVLEAAARQFQRWLRDDDASAAVAYLKNRGLSGEIARDFGIGLAPGRNRLKTALASFGEQKLIDAGLLGRSERGGESYDRFRERIVFPIRNTRGRVIGFGGRVYGDGQPKYINSPETAVFRKGRELYGLYEARRAQRGLQSVVVVEGYMDVVALAQQGVTNAVATLGTAIGQTHFETLYRHVDLVVCCFDGDEAGRGAAWKAVDAAFPALSETRQLRFVFLPEGEDPDTVVRDRGAAHFRQLVDDAVPVGEYFLDHLREGLDLDAADGRALLAELAAPHIRRLPRGSLREIIINDLGLRARMDVAAVARTAQIPDGDERVPVAAGRSGQEQGVGNKRLLKYVVQYPQLIDGLDSQMRTELADAADTSLLADVVRHLVEEPGMDTGTLIGCFVGREGYDELAALAGEEVLLPEEAVVLDLDARARRYIVKRRGSALLRKALESGSMEDAQRRWSDAKAQQTL
ncbi:MAG: DNA primase [Gammaproteobacteria bacterium]|nr:DNA primase [Gammaproteobacteria bacterium]